MSGQRSLSAVLGPLKYHFQAHDTWGEKTLSRLRRQTVCLPFATEPGRTIHLLREPSPRGNRGRISAGVLPPRLAAVLPSGAPRRGWRLDLDSTLSLSRTRPGYRHGTWTYPLRAAEDSLRFRLPWPVMLSDIVSAGGGLLHAGLAVSRERVFLFAAPSGGGKSTALARLPGSWTVEADDAVLVWPEGPRAVRASPLPTWSIMAGRNSKPDWLDRWNLGRSWRVDEVVILEKARFLKRSPLDPDKAAPLLYRALSDHPECSLRRHLYRVEFFRTACRLARSVPASVLRLDLRGAFWKLLGPQSSPRTP
jgi:hypothetical protein